MDNIKKVRQLDAQFEQEILPKLPPSVGKDEPFQLDKLRGAMARLKQGKDRALAGPWSALKDSVNAENILIQMRDGHEVQLRIYTPKTQSESRVVCYSTHGGGFLSGDCDSEDLINRQLSTVCDLLIFSIDYRLGPENDVATTTFQDAEDGMKWVYENAAKYGGDTSKGCYVSGTSTGGQLALLLAFRSKDLGIPVRGMLLRQAALIFGPFKDEWKPYHTSLEENAEAPGLNAAAYYKMNAFLNFAPSIVTNPRYFPIYASKAEMANLPPAYLIAAGCDPMADDIVLLGKLLEEAGVQAKVKVYDGVPHGFHGFFTLKKAQDEMVDTGNGMKWLMSL